MYGCPCGSASVDGADVYAAVAVSCSTSAGCSATVGCAVNVTVTKAGFVPSKIPAKKGEVLNLVVTRKVDGTCATEIVQKEQGVNAPLPLGQPVAVTLTAPSDGKLQFSCAHGHITGEITGY